MPTNAPESSCRRTGPADRGIALLHVLLLIVLLTAAAGGAALLGRVEVLVAQHHRADRDAGYATQAMLAMVLRELDVMPDWNAVLAGSSRASFTDGPPGGAKRIPDAGTIEVCCGTGSLTARARAESGVAWVPFAWHSFRGLLSIPEAPPYYLAAWVLDDGEEVDGDAAADSNDRLLVRVEAVTPLGSRRVAEALVERATLDPASGIRLPGVRLAAWHEER